MRLVAASVLIALLLAVPSAAAQAPSMTVTITGAPAEFPSLASNGTAQATFTVEVVLENVVCPQDTSIPVMITATPQSPPPFLTFAVEPTEAGVPVTAGPHGGEQAGSPATGSVPGTLTATAGTIDANASVPVELVATAGAPAGCQGAGSIPSATSQPVTVFANVTAPPPPPEPTPENNDSPAPGFVLVALVALGVALMRRKRA